MCTLRRSPTELVEESSVSFRCLGQMTLGQMTFGQMAFGQITLGQMTLGQMTIERSGYTAFSILYPRRLPSSPLTAARFRSILPEERHSAPGPKRR